MKYPLLVGLISILLLTGCISSNEKILDTTQLDTQPIKNETQISNTSIIPIKENVSVIITEDKMELTLPKAVLLLSDIENNCIGFLVGSKEEARMISLVGAGWARPHPGPFAWGSIEKNKGSYDFTFTDHYVTSAQENNIAILATVWPFAEWDQDKASCEVSKQDIFYPKDPLDPSGIPPYRCKPKDMAAYKTFLTALVERYDGDGIDDMPGLKIPVKYWEILNEPEMKSDELTFFIGDEADYVEVLKQSHDAIKETCPECKVVQAGCAGTQEQFLSFWGNVFDLGGAKYFDIANIHHISGPDTDTLNVKDFKSLLDSHNITKPIWVTEVEYQNSGVDVLGSVNGAFDAGASKIFFVSFNVGGHSPPVPGVFSPTYREAVSLCRKEKSTASAPEVNYFYSSKCFACKEVAPLVNEIKGNFTKYSTFKEYDVTTKEGLTAFKQFVAGHNITKTYIPTINIGNQTLVGLDQMTRENLYSAMFEYLNITGNDLKKANT